MIHEREDDNFYHDPKMHASNEEIDQYLRLDKLGMKVCPDCEGNPGDWCSNCGVKGAVKITNPDAYKAFDSREFFTNMIESYKPNI